MNRETLNAQRSNLPLPTPLPLGGAGVRVRRMNQIQNLRRTRDLLLPRLLSGQVDLQ
jgi:hypothetical protein